MCQGNPPVQLGESPSWAVWTNSPSASPFLEMVDLLFRDSELVLVISSKEKALRKDVNHLYPDILCY